MNEGPGHPLATCPECRFNARPLIIIAMKGAAWKADAFFMKHDDHGNILCSDVAIGAAFKMRTSNVSHMMKRIWHALRMEHRDRCLQLCSDEELAIKNRYIERSRLRHVHNDDDFLTRSKRLTRLT